MKEIDRQEHFGREMDLIFKGVYMWKGYENFDHYFTYDQFNEFWDEVSKLTSFSEVRKSDTAIRYINIPCSFDIETTSTYTKDHHKFTTMYVWQFGINGSVIIGRTWYELLDLLSKLQKLLNLRESYRRLIVYIHNLSYEFQFMRKWIKWAKNKDGKDAVFSVKNRKPLYAITDGGIEFRCSYLLSNCNLAYIGAKMLYKYPVRKLVGKLDYQLIRHSKTPLSTDELDYCCNDVRVVMAYIEEKIENEGGICNIPYTNTGYVRNYCRAYCFGEFEKTEKERKKRKYEYHEIMKALKIKSSKEYTQLRKAFAGGFTHANPNHVGKLMKNVGSIDLASSYPTVMCSEQFPMSSGIYLGKIKDMKKFKFLLENYCCLFTCIFYNIYGITEDNYISVSKLTDVSKEYVSNNGRLADADFCQLTITDVDYEIISKTYECDWSKMEILDMRVYERGYLPRPFIMSILDLYKNKTSLKDVIGREIEYMISKNMINASYGMAVTSIVREMISHEYEWNHEEGDAEEQLDDYNKDFTRFLFYPWGVWITAYARRNLWNGILEFGNDYVYADTDSIKAINMDKHQRFITDYNMNIRSKLYKMCRIYNISILNVEPLTPKGKPKLLGVWEREEGYKYFKTMGAKRYLYQYESGLPLMTVSGVNKMSAMPYLLEKYCKIPHEIAYGAYNTDPTISTKEGVIKLIHYLDVNKISLLPLFNAFNEGLSIPPGKSGKLTHTYLEKNNHCLDYILKDYTGISMLCHEKSTTHLEPAGYDFSMTQEYLDFLNGIIQQEC